MNRTSNQLYKCLVYDGQISLSVLDTKPLVQRALDIHRPDDKTGKIFGCLLTACAYMAGCLKSPKGAVSLTVKAGEGGCTVSVSGDSQGHIRGCIDGGDNGLKGGTLTVIKDDGFSRPFVGTCLMESDDVSQNLEEYFRQSEQIATRVRVSAEVENGVCKTAGGIVMQQLPGTSEENAEKCEERMRAFENFSYPLSRLGAEGILREYFAEEYQKGGVYLTFPEYKCNCSRKKIEGVILSLGKDELYKILEEEGKISVHCHYCNTDYTFDKADVDGLLKNA